jgi:hypothetical protein
MTSCANTTYPRITPNVCFKHDIITYDPTKNELSYELKSKILKHNRLVEEGV